MKKSNKRTRTTRKWHGGKWIRPEKRLAIYDRDSWCCVYCGWAEDVPPDEGFIPYANHLTLDHVRPVDRGGSNEPDNLVTACHKCNSRRQHRTSREWNALLRRAGIDTDEVRKRVRRLTRRLIDLARGKALLRERYARRTRYTGVSGPA